MPPAAAAGAFDAIQIDKWALSTDCSLLKTRGALSLSLSLSPLARKKKEEDNAETERENALKERWREKESEKNRVGY